jgi:predicted metal-dependent phosphoesterase TrpH
MLMGFADLHLHSVYSRDGVCSVEIILRQAQLRQLDIIAITDHNSMHGVPEALTLMKKYNLQIIPGIEISTANGHLLAYEIYHPLPPRLPLKETVLRIHELGGFCIIPHPMSLGTDAIRQDVLLDALQHPDAAKTILGIEIINGGFLRRNQSAVGLAEQYQLAPVGNSDGHNINSIGRAVTQFQGSTVQDLKDALLQRQTTPCWYFRIADPLYYPLHTAYHGIRELGYAVGFDETTQHPRLFPVSQLKRRI